MKRTCFCDTETFSEVDIGKCGSYRYIEDNSTEVLLLTYAFGDEPVNCVDLASGDPWPEEFLAAYDDPNTLLIAHNCSGFEWPLFNRFLRPLPPERYFDTMHLAAQCGLPQSLGGAGEAIGLTEEQAKIKDGRALIRYFCTPCKPTKSNGQRERNLPEHDPEKWTRFKEYAVRDVVAMRTIYHHLEQWMPDAAERRFWALDARINAHGVRIDRKLATNAVLMDAKNKEELTAEAIALTGMENPKSVSQIKSWLYDQEGKEFPSLNKKVLVDVIPALKSEDAKQFMALRTELSKSSTAKYNAMLRSMSPKDDHVRGCFRFYGANRTGRFAGALVQFQNLSKNYDANLDGMRELVKGGHYTALKALYDGVADPLSQLVRTAIIPEEGHKILVADFSAIEARVTAWFAGEEWKLQAFRDGQDIYCATASQMFHVPVVKHGINGELRQKGKVAELACIAEGELVLTDRGLVPIQNVTLSHRVWDGREWVAHDGVVCRGEKEVITYGGLTATPDHMVFIEGSDRPVQFGDAAARGARLLQSGAGGAGLREGEGHFPREALSEGLGTVHGADAVHELRKVAVDKPQQPSPRKKPGLSTLFPAKTNSEVAGSPTHRGEGTLREPFKSAIRQLRRAWYNLRLPKCPFGGVVDHRSSWTSGSVDGTGQKEQRPRLRAGKPTLGDALRKQPEQAYHSPSGVDTRGLAIRTDDCPAKTKLRNDPARGHTGRRNGCVGAEEKLESNQGLARRTSRVYDIINAGTRHRFTVSGVLVHNCGYGGGVNALKAFGADKMGMTDEEMQDVVDKWRDSNANVAAWWKTMENAAVRAVARQVETVDKIGKIAFSFENGVLFMKLPSGRRLAYWGAAYGESRFQPGRKTLSYMGVNQQTKKWSRVETWGGKLVENCWAAGTLVCTNHGWLPIEKVARDDLIWDGFDWVKHDGAVCRGSQRTMSVDGERCTPDHKIRTTRGWQYAKNCDGLDRLPVQLPATYVADYVKTPLTVDPSGREEPVYDLLNCGERHQFVILTRKGPLIVHNCVQATARDVLREAMFALDEQGYQVIAHVHDECIVTEPITSGRTYEDMAKTMCPDIPWAKGLPLEAAGYDGDYYFKD